MYCNISSTRKITTDCTIIKNCQKWYVKALKENWMTCFNDVLKLHAILNIFTTWYDTFWHLSVCLCVCVQAQSIQCTLFHHIYLLFSVELKFPELLLDELHGPVLEVQDTTAYCRWVKSLIFPLYQYHWWNCVCQSVCASDWQVDDLSEWSTLGSTA